MQLLADYACELCPDTGCEINKKTYLYDFIVTQVLSFKIAEVETYPCLPCHVVLQVPDLICPQELSRVGHGWETSSENQMLI